jgi:carbon storage regulator
VLVVSRKIGERILIGDKVAVTVVKIGNGGVRIGIEAPPEMAIMREELAQQIEQAEQRLRADQLETDQLGLDTPPPVNSKLAPES